MTKPSLDSIGNWLEGRLTKFIAGEGETSVNGLDGAVETPAYSAFSHFSSISSAAPSMSSSPQPSTHNFAAPSRRTGNGGDHTGTNVYSQIDRSSSAMDYSRPVSRKPSPGPKIVSASAAMASFSQSPSYPDPSKAYAPASAQGALFSQSPHYPQMSSGNYAPASAQASLFSQSPSYLGASGQNDSSLSQDVQKDSSDKLIAEVEDQAPSWWNPSYSYDHTSQTPLASSFPRDDDEPSSAGSASGSGFISLMDVAPLPMTAASSQNGGSGSHHSRENDLEENDDLGLGNSKPKKMKEMPVSPTVQAAPKEIPKVEEAKTPGEFGRFQIDGSADKHQDPPTQSASWLGRWWGKKDPSAPGPIKASLGEETSFVYDKELKRWVNKKVRPVPFSLFPTLIDSIKGW